MARTVYLVPHTHWDREWYQPHELFRWRLVQMIDELIAHMESHPEYRCFNLDGQSIVIADYLELRPENEGRLRALIEAGRILIGPWWVQPDEFLPSGESHIRSFQKGIRFAERLGGSLRIGHCADQFGHIAQMPQLMSQLGMTSACLWRGVPDSVPGWSFWWEAPDGTRLPVLYLRNSYSSGWRLPKNVDDFIERIRRQERDRRDDEPALLMNGTDHSRAELGVPETVAAARGRGYNIRMATLAEYERAMFAAGLDETVHRGELRSPDRSNVLVGVLSARTNIKQRDFQVSAAIERYAEPLDLLSWLHGGPDALPALRQAWRLLLENSPHDSICGCSVDQTHREMFPRYDRAEQLAHQVAREAAAHLIARLEVPAASGLVTWRPVPHASATFECQVPGEWEAAALRLPSGDEVPCALGPIVPGEVLQHEEVSPRGAGRHLDFIREGRYDVHAVEGVTWELDGRHLRVETVVGEAVNVVDDATLREEVREIGANNLADTAEVTVRTSSRRTLRAVLPPSRAVGLDLITPGQGGTGAAGAGAVIKGNGIANEFYEVQLRKGGLEVRDRATGWRLGNVNAFVSEGDRGDEYNADILPGGVVQPAYRELLEVHGDGVSVSLRYLSIMAVPAGLNAKRSRRSRKETAPVTIDTTVTAWAGLPRIDFRVAINNMARDHRLRALFPLPFRVTSAWTENHFHVAERSLTPPPWNGISPELPPTTLPQKTFAAFEDGGHGLAVFNRGLQEGEVVSDLRGRQAYALTLLRCVGWLSRPDLASRRGGAGPTIATEDSQVQGEHVFEYALTTYAGAWHEANIQPMAHSFAFPPVAWVTNEHEGSLRGSLDLVRITPAAVIPSALHRSDADGRPIIRFYNSAGSAVEAAVEATAMPRAVRLCDLLERPGKAAARSGGVVSVALRPWQIATLRFGERRSRATRPRTNAARSPRGSRQSR